MTHDGNRRRRFGYWLAALWLSSFVFVAIGTPPDPFSQLAALGPLLGLDLIIAYLAVYRLGW